MGFGALLLPAPPTDDLLAQLLHDFTECTTSVGEPENPVSIGAGCKVTHASVCFFVDPRHNVDPLFNKANASTFIALEIPSACLSGTWFQLRWIFSHFEDRSSLLCIAGAPADIVIWIL
jgi:hypothetical protein